VSYLHLRPTARRPHDKEDKMSPKPAKKPAPKPEEAKFVVDRGRLRQPSIDAEPSRNPVFDAIGRGLMRLGQKVNRQGFSPSRI
jgi:hypothetical protein